jgi:glucan phosphorylase
MEASGTGNMKLALNGALTIGTLDGANIEIKEHVGGENMFIFGLLAEEVAERRRAGLDMTATIDASPALKEVLDGVESGMFSADDRNRYRDLVDGLRHHDYFMVTADFEAYRSAQQRRQRAVAGQERMVAHRRAQHGTDELVFGRPRDPRLRAGDLARGTGAHLKAKRAAPPRQSIR